VFFRTRDGTVDQSKTSFIINGEVVTAESASGIAVNVLRAAIDRMNVDTMMYSTSAGVKNSVVQRSSPLGQQSNYKQRLAVTTSGNRECLPPLGVCLHVHHSMHVHVLDTIRCMKHRYLGTMAKASENCSAVASLNHEQPA
jgi:hypothetical protein